MSKMQTSKWNPERIALAWTEQYSRIAIVVEYSSLSITFLHLFPLPFLQFYMQNLLLQYMSHMHIWLPLFISVILWSSCIAYYHYLYTFILVISCQGITLKNTKCTGRSIFRGSQIRFDVVLFLMITDRCSQRNSQQSVNCLWSLRPAEH